MEMNNPYTPKMAMDEKLKKYKLNQKKVSSSLKLKEKPRLAGSPTFGKPNTGRFMKKV